MLYGQLCVKVVTWAAGWAARGAWWVQCEGGLLMCCTCCVSCMLMVFVFAFAAVDVG